MTSLAHHHKSTALAPVLATAFALAALAASAPAQAQRIEAARYVNEQGVEFLVNRSAPRPRDAVNSGTDDAAAAARVKPASAPAAGSEQSPFTAPQRAEQRVDQRADPRADQRVGLVQQSARDSERARILTQELLAEGQALEVKRKALKSPRAQTDLNSDDRQKLADDVQRHEANVKALDRELGALSGTGVARKGLQPSAVNWAP